MLYLFGHQRHLRRWQSGQLHRTVNPTTLVYVGSNPTRRTKNKREYV